MTQTSLRPIRRLRGRLGGEDGFTLVEVLVSMIVLVVFLAGTTTLFTTAFHTVNSSNARTAEVNQAGVRLEVLSRDLRDAVPCPGAILLSGATSTAVDIQVSSGPQLQMCDPAPGLPASSGAAQIPQVSIVTWTCSTGTGKPDTCNRCVTSSSAAAPSSCSSSSSALTNTIVGVQSISLSGLSGSPAATVGTLSGGYALSAGGLSWVGINAQLGQLSYPNTSSPLTATVVANSQPITLQTGADLRNYGT